MKKLNLFVCVLSACASTQRSDSSDHALLRGFGVEEVREATRLVVEEIAPPQSVVRARGDRVLTEGRIGVCDRDVACGGRALYIDQNTGTPWATIEVRFLELGEDIAVNVEIEYQSSSHCMDRSPVVTCLPDQLGSTGFLERRIIDGIRARLEAKEDVAETHPTVVRDW